MRREHSFKGRSSRGAVPRGNLPLPFGQIVIQRIRRGSRLRRHSHVFRRRLACRRRVRKFHAAQPALFRFHIDSLDQIRQDNTPSPVPIFQIRKAPRKWDGPERIRCLRPGRWPRPIPPGIGGAIEALPRGPGIRQRKPEKSSRKSTGSSGARAAYSSSGEALEAWTR